MAPTGDQVISYAMSLRKANYGPPENLNRFTRSYFGNDTRAQWCEIFEYEVFAHFPGGAALFHGKSASVPNMPSHFGKDWRHPHDKSIYPGCPVALGMNNIPGPEHTGLFVRWANAARTAFVCIEGNTTHGGSTDAVDDKTRPWSAVTGWAAIKFAEPDPSSYPGRIYQYVEGRPLMQDSHVTWIQQRLAKNDHNVTVDGQYGPLTAAEVKAFQHDAHLTVDGQVGPITWKALAK
jgi:hypothetical protein